MEYLGHETNQVWSGHKCICKYYLQYGALQHELFSGGHGGATHGTTNWVCHGRPVGKMMVNPTEDEVSTQFWGTYGIEIVYNYFGNHTPEEPNLP